jgi:8-oxo-dGTP pyrophosphatase MutT (NUDIX family)
MAALYRAPTEPPIRSLPTKPMTSAREVLFDRWRERARREPLRPREALAVADGRAIGSIEPAVAAALAGDGLLVAAGTGRWTLPALPAGLDAAVAAVAEWLRDQGLAGRWRDELLDVTTVEVGERIGAIERAAVRPLGITTFAVHLIGRHPDGRCWVQQRALDKATDPGLWDTLMGGLRAAGESVRETLERETWEEAGLRLADLRDLQARGRFTIRRPVSEGYMVEHLDVFEATVPEGLVPENRDGEVARFACLDDSELDALLADDAFTLEAALMLCGATDQRPD